MTDPILPGVIVTPLKIISHAKGDVMHAMKSSDPGYAGFGEAYFSSVLSGEIKGWKRHRRMTLNLVVPCGAIRFVVYDNRQGAPGRFFDIELSRQNYCRLTVPPGVWMAFAGIGSGLNLLMNAANIEHEPEESDNCPLGEIVFNWSKQS